MVSIIMVPPEKRPPVLGAFLVVKKKGLDIFLR